jgi:hypothetical protein
MTKLVCDFTFDEHIYALTVDVDAALNISNCRALANTGPRSADVHEQCAMIGVLVSSGVSFDYFENATKLGPLTMSIVAGIVRARDRAAAADVSARRAKERALIEGSPQ